MLDEYHKKAKKRLLSKIKIDEKTSCWNWTATISRSGYGRIGYKYSNHPAFEAYRLSYILFREKLDPDLEIDHICRNRKCVNPYHLEQVTKKENILRGVGVGAKNKAKTHCPQGHEYTPDNIRIGPCNGGRYCRTCQKDRDRYRHVQKNAKVLLNAEVQ